MTTFTTIAGLLPLTLTNNALWSPLGWAIVGGLSTSAFLTLIVVPALYRIFTPQSAVKPEKSYKEHPEEGDHAVAREGLA